MAGFIQIFQNIFTYPALNLFMWFYHFTNNFALTIILFALILYFILSWPAGYMDELTQRDERYYQAISTPADKILYPWRNHFLSAGTRMQLGCLTFIISMLKIYLTIGLYLALSTLNGLSLSSLNAILYPFMPHLSALPDYSFTFLHETTSLVQRGFLWSFLLLLAIPTLMDAYLRSGSIVRVEGIGNCWSKMIVLFGQSFLLNLVIALLLSWLLASGVFLALAVDNFLRVLLLAYIIKRSRL